MGRQLPDLFDGCYDGEHRKLKSPVQFKDEFCAVCMNVGCRNSKGAGSLWNQRMQTQEDRLLNNPEFAPENTALVMGLPDFRNMIQDALKIEISTQRGDWEPVSDADVGRAAAEMMGVIPPGSPMGFQPEPEPEPKTLTCGHPIEADPAHNDPNPYATHYCMVCQALAEARDPEPDPPERDPTTVTPEQISKPDNDPAPQEPTAPLAEGVWRVRGSSLDSKGKPRTYTVALYADEVWECNCPSREEPCKHIQYIQARLTRTGLPQPPPDPVRPPATPRRSSFPTAMNTVQPQGGVTVGAAEPLAPTSPDDPWAVPGGVKMRTLEVGGKVTFGSGTKKK